MTDYELVVGCVDPLRSFERLVDVVARVAGATVREIPGESRSVVGTLAEGKFWVQFDPADLEPFASHPYVIELKLEFPSREPKLGADIFDALVADGYRVILLADGGSIRSSHFSEEDRGDEATDGGSVEAPPT
ncbi:hypothetical protein GA0070216_1155 [Micromonospora matsumotoense]|uniref:Uncharacterized protein n=1 Tax=Micromonospora matsumotoense TaxID=121616 RepID=A0A1C5AA49_9ACTN|nr:hypothetical protein [Micromonospora matsumotoense]SCF41884.1 hypothetical protein GA0070216_1155 [Micromonospora matsumotoense]